MKFLFLKSRYLADTFGMPFDKYEKLKARFRRILRKLQQLPGHNLLVIDNAQEQVAQKEVYEHLPGPPNWNVLLTSRLSLGGFEQMRLETLAPAAALETQYSLLSKQLQLPHPHSLHHRKLRQYLDLWKPLPPLYQPIPMPQPNSQQPAQQLLHRFQAFALVCPPLQLLPDSPPGTGDNQRSSRQRITGFNADGIQPVAVVDRRDALQVEVGRW